MAAIIAQMSLANRERKKRLAERGNKQIGPDKCVYHLPPFDQCYDPIKHNKYMKIKQHVDRRKMIVNAAKCKYVCGGIIECFVDIFMYKYAD